MKNKRAKSRRNIQRGERHGYFTEGKMRKEISESKAIKKEVEKEIESDINLTNPLI